MIWKKCCSPSQQLMFLQTGRIVYYWLQWGELQICLTNVLKEFYEKYYTLFILKYNRLNQYNSIRLFVFFDLPTETQLYWKTANKFKNKVIRWWLFNVSIFHIHNILCKQRKFRNAHKTYKNSLPKRGKVGVIIITDKQFEMLKLFYLKKNCKNTKTIATA